MGGGLYSYLHVCVRLRAARGRRGTGLLHTSSGGNESLIHLPASPQGVETPLLSRLAQVRPFMWDRKPGGREPRAPDGRRG